MSEWSHLSNGKHINCVLASVKAYSTEWGAALGAARGAAWNATRGAAYQAWCAALDATRDATRVVAWDAASAAVLALIAHDNCAKFLDMESNKLRSWIAISEDQAAILLLPAVIAFEKIKELTINLNSAIIQYEIK